VEKYSKHPEGSRQKHPEPKAVSGKRQLLGDQSQEVMWGGDKAKKVNENARIDRKHTVRPGNPLGEKGPGRLDKRRKGIEMGEAVGQR